MFTRFDFFDPLLPPFIDRSQKRKCTFKIFSNEKFKKIFYLFMCMLPDYLAHDITKKFEEKRRIENMTTSFSQRCQNPLR